MVIRENLFVIDFIAGARATCPCLGRHMGLPLPEIVIYHYIISGMPKKSASFLKN